MFCRISSEILTSLLKRRIKFTATVEDQMMRDNDPVLKKREADGQLTTQGQLFNELDKYITGLNRGKSKLLQFIPKINKS